MMEVPISEALTFPSPELLVAIAVAAFAASTVAAVAGFGGSAILLPLLVPAFGPRDAVIIMTIVQLVGNSSRVIFNRTELVLPVVAWFSLGAVPFAIVGGLAFAAAPLTVLTRLLGVFLIAMVIWRQLPISILRGKGMPIQSFTGIGALSSFISALIGTVGPLMVPFFLAFGLTKGSYISTEALSTVVIQVVKVGTYAGTDAMTLTALITGIALAPLMIAGSLAGKRLLHRVSDRAFVWIIEAAMLVSGIFFVIQP
ncbi:MAG: sulfite exporter TauE/SafE family protein [Chloroflexota bacterium]|nr:sulfite exporter TauE/SafE family protein [Chloroflexota bacterium]